jgi:SWI/SNF-related matrix-associated actin-dependent regulator 1 of chromatin subfamily A
MAQKNHPVVDKYNLRTYYNKFDNQRCAISGQDVEKGVRVANVAPLMTVLNALGMISTKVFKYARIALLPMMATEKETALIRAAAERLLSMTDPKWPKDHIGCSASSYHPLNNWMSFDCHELGTQRAAQALRQHVGTQIAKDSSEAKAILAVADRQWNENRPKAKREPDTVCEEGFIVRNHRLKGEMLVDVPTKRGATVAINPWENEGHGAIKDALRSLGARWDSVKKVWAVALTALAVAMKDLDSLAVTDKTPVVVTPRALDALRAEWERAVAEPKADETVKLGDTTATVRRKRQRRPGEVMLDVNGSGLKVMFDFPKEGKLLLLKNNVKAYGGRWDPKAKCWTLGANTTAENLHMFDDHKLVVTPEAIEAMSAVFERRALASAMDLDDEELKRRINAAVPEGKELFPFQAAAVAFLEKSGGCGLIGDEMGTGKTIETAAFLAYRKDLRPAVVVVPAVVSTNWVKELEAWTEGESIYRIKNRKDEAPEGTSIVVVTYDLVKQHKTKEEKEEEKKKGEEKGTEAREAIKAMNPKCIVADECHYLKNIKAQRTKAFLDLATQKTVESIVLLSGTPILNCPKEFYTALSLLRPAEFNSWFKFTERYCGGYQGEYGYVADGVTNTKELASRLKDVMIRRLKKDVLEELPAKLRGRVTVQVAPKARAAYNRAVKAADTTLTKITAGRHALGLAKVAPAVDLANEYADQNKPLLIFAHHQDVLNGLCEGLDKEGVSYGRIDGSVSHERRGQLVDAFQAGGLDVMVLSTKAAGVGITLTHASDVLFVERSWTPADEEQAEDRAHRIGQTDSVTVRYMVVPNTLDEDMDDLIESKRAVLHAVLNQGKMLPEDMDIRKELAARMEARTRDGKSKRKKRA